MKYTGTIKDFIKEAKTPYHAVSLMKNILEAEGYTQISESDTAGFCDGKGHFVVRADSSLIAFCGEGDGFMITATHSDTPTFKVKNEVKSAGYTKLSVEPYGGMINYTWLDRPLSLAGRVVLKTDDGIQTRLVDLDRDLVVIPSVAIHLNRSVNEGYKFNPATDMLPLYSSGSDADCLSELARENGIDKEKIISHDLYLYNREEPRCFGKNGEFILSPRLDDLACVYISLVAFLSQKENSGAVRVLAVFNNEEVGSSTKQGANSTFFESTLEKIAGNIQKYSAMLENSFIISADNAHARHPNHPELSDPENAPLLGSGVVVKYNANQRYATDAVSDAVIRTLSQRCGARLCSYFNRADMPGGSTLGSIANTKVSVMTADIGLAQLAMHSASECCSERDIDDMKLLLSEFYSSSIEAEFDEIKIKKA